MPLIADSEFAGLRAALEITLTHRYTRVRVATGGGGEDTWGDTDQVPQGSADEGIPCLWEAKERAVRDETGVTVVSNGTLTVSATDPLTIGDRVSAITDQLGGTPPGASGVFTVERVADATAGLGAALLPSYELLAARAT